MRARYNVLVLPYRLVEGEYQFAVFHRVPPHEMWQFVAGGGEDDEMSLVAAKRETREEAGISAGAWLPLDSVASIPRTAFPGAPWPADVYVVPEHCFAVHVDSADITLCHEHDRYEWLSYEAAYERLTWDSNRVALWELRERLRSGSAT